MADSKNQKMLIGSAEAIFVKDGFEIFCFQQTAPSTKVRRHFPGSQRAAIQEQACVGLNSQAFAPFGAAVLESQAAFGGRHAGAEPMGAFAFQDGGLEGTFHGENLV